MVVSNDIGLTLEIIGFLIFLYVPITESFNLTLEHKSNKITKFIDNHKKIRYGSRTVGVTIIIIGLIMQYSFFQ